MIAIYKVFIFFRIALVRALWYGGVIMVVFLFNNDLKFIHRLVVLTFILLFFTVFLAILEYLRYKRRFLNDENFRKRVQSAHKQGYRSLAKELSQ